MTSRSRTRPGMSATPRRPRRPWAIALLILGVSVAGWRLYFSPRAGEQPIASVAAGKCSHAAGRLLADAGESDAAARHTAGRDGLDSRR